jgi:hypothetical protein
MGSWTRAELQEAHDRFIEVANESGAKGDWGPWVEMFTEDAEYIEHHYGRFHGRAEILAWISTTMAQWPNNEMTMFPHDWCVCDEDGGRWICQIENRFNDPGDGGVYQASNITILTYAGQMQFASEEDVYNPATFAPVVTAWMAAKKAHTPS